VVKAIVLLNKEADKTLFLTDSTTGQ